MTSELPRVLCVDDEPALLTMIARVLGVRYDVTTADRPLHALELLKTEPPFAVVLSDFEMPGLTGAEFLRAARQVVPSTVRVLFSGNADVSDAASAVNEGQVFRLLIKPFSPPALLEVVAAAVEQHRVVVAEQAILEQTLQGVVAALGEVLALAQPMAFGRAKRMRRHVADLAGVVGAPNTWEIEVAAFLSQLGCVSLSAETVERLYHGRSLSAAESAQVARLPAIAEELIAHVPRLEPVREIIRQYDLRFDGRERQFGEPLGTDITLGARMLHIARDFDFLIAEGNVADKSLETMAGRVGAYDPELLAAFRAIRSSGSRQAEMRDMRLGDVREGMTFAADLLSPSGLLLVARGQAVTSGLIYRIRHQWSGSARFQIVRMVINA